MNPAPPVTRTVPSVLPETEECMLSMLVVPHSGLPEETALDERVPPRFVQTGKTSGFSYLGALVRFLKYRHDITITTLMYSV